MSIVNVLRWNTFHVNIKCLVSFFVLVIKKKLHFTHGQPIAFSWRLLIGSNAAPRKKKPDNNKNNFHFPSVLQVFFSHQTKIISEICTCMLFTEIRHILKLYFRHSISMILTYTTVSLWHGNKNEFKKMKFVSTT